MRVNMIMPVTFKAYNKTFFTPKKDEDKNNSNLSSIDMCPGVSYSIVVTRQKAMGNKMNKLLEQAKALEKEGTELYSAKEEELDEKGIKRKIQNVYSGVGYSKIVTFENHKIEKMFIKENGAVIKTKDDMYDSKKGIFAHNITSEYEEGEISTKAEELVVTDTNNPDKTYLLINYRAKKDKKLASRIYVKENETTKQLKNGRTEYKHALKISPTRYELVE